MKLRWRKFLDRHYYEGKLFGYGHVDKRDEGWLASVPYTGALETFATLREAKNFVQVQVAKKMRRNTPSEGTDQ